MRCCIRRNLLTLKCCFLKILNYFGLLEKSANVIHNIILYPVQKMSQFVSACRQRPLLISRLKATTHLVFSIGKMWVCNEIQQVVI